jgi:hypothetical protein
MSLNVIADILDGATIDPRDEAQLKARFRALIAGLELGHISIDAVRIRCVEMAAIFTSGHARDRADLLRAHTEAMNAFAEQHHYFRPGPLTDYLDERAVTIQVNEGGALGLHWLGRRTFAQDIAAAFDSGLCAGFVGREGRPIWLTPCIGPVKHWCDEANSEYVPAWRRAQIARDIVDLLGLAHVRRNNELIAFVTARTIGELLFKRPDDASTVAPVGPTAVEARVHARFRHWPADHRPELYGRTYQLDNSGRTSAAPPGYYGAWEAVRPRLDMTEFGACIYLGTLTDPRFDDLDDVYLHEIGASTTSVEMLRRLHGLLGP